RRCSQRTWTAPLHPLSQSFSLSSLTSENLPSPTYNMVDVHSHDTLISRLSYSLLNEKGYNRCDKRNMTTLTDVSTSPTKPCGKEWTGTMQSCVELKTEKTLTGLDYLSILATPKITPSAQPAPSSQPAQPAPSAQHALPSPSAQPAPSAPPPYSSPRSNFPPPPYGAIPDGSPLPPLDVGSCALIQLFPKASQVSEAAYQTQKATFERIRDVRAEAGENHAVDLGQPFVLPQLLGEATFTTYYLSGDGLVTVECYALVFEAECLVSTGPNGPGKPRTALGSPQLRRPSFMYPAPKPYLEALEQLLNHLENAYKIVSGTVYHKYLRFQSGTIYVHYLPKAVTQGCVDQGTLIKAIEGKSREIEYINDSKKRIAEHSYRN
ncbi:hypothetical protein FA95DRAFT_1618677, partial [Auriscalpium vulgare]